MTDERPCRLIGCQYTTRWGPLCRRHRIANRALLRLKRWSANRTAL